MRYHIITYCSSGYANCLRSTINSWLDNGEMEQILVYSDSAVDLGIKDTRVLINNIFARPKIANTHYTNKAMAILDAMQRVDNILMLDADCLIVNTPRQFFNRRFDVAPTLWGIDTNHIVTENSFRGKRNSMWNDVSAGTLFVHNTPTARLFIEEWIRIQNELIGEKLFRGYVSKNVDQRALTQTCRHAISADDTTVIAANARIFNNYPETHYTRDVLKWINNMCADTKIFHLAHGIWNNREVVDSIARIYGK